MSSENNPMNPFRQAMPKDIQPDDLNYGNLAKPAPGLLDYLQRLQINASLNSFQNGPVSGVAGGGRIGYKHPLTDGALTVGLQGSGYNVVNGANKDSRFSIDGIDANYTNGNYSVGFDASKQGINNINASYQDKAQSINGNLGRDSKGKPKIGAFYNKQF